MLKHIKTLIFIQKTYLMYYHFIGIRIQWRTGSDIAYFTVVRGMSLKSALL